MIRYADQQEKMISPEGTYPVLGRSMGYRFGAFLSTWVESHNCCNNPNENYARHHTSHLLYTILYVSLTHNELVSNHIHP